MQEVIQISRREIPQVFNELLQGYRGRKFRVLPKEGSLELHGAFWDGGSRNQWYAVRLSDGLTQLAGGKLNTPAEYGGRPYEARSVQMTPGVVIAEHSIFCGKDVGWRFYVHPADMAKLLTFKG